MFVMIYTVVFNMVSGFPVLALSGALQASVAVRYLTMLYCASKLLLSAWHSHSQKFYYLLAIMVLWSVKVHCVTTS